MNILIQQSGHQDTIVLEDIPYCRVHLIAMIPKKYGGTGYYKCSDSGCFEFCNLSNRKEDIEKYLINNRKWL